jgi:hypothetical protein
MAFRVVRRARVGYGVVAIVATCVAAGMAGCSLDSSGGSDETSEAGLGETPDATRDALIDVLGEDARPYDAADAMDAADALDAQDAADARDAGKDGCAPKESDCQDGIDNDCNGLTDCADPACTPLFRCVTVTPTWTGFTQYQDTRAACPATSPTSTDTFEALTVPPATCTACQCSPSGVTCGGSAKLACGPAGVCTTASTVSESVGASCAALSAPAVLGPLDACNVTAPAAAGSCAPGGPGGGGGGGVPNGVAPSFAKLSRVCGGTRATAGGCATGSVCVARTPLAAHGLCVARAVPDGTLAPACPAAFPAAHVTAPTAASFVDARTCTACGCGALAGATCASRVTLYSGGGCTAAEAGSPPPPPPPPDPDASVPLPGIDAGAPADSAFVDSDGVCHDVVSSVSTFASAIASFTVVAQGTCGTTGGAPQGTATAKTQTEYCCEK